MAWQQAYVYPSLAGQAGAFIIHQLPNGAHRPTNPPMANHTRTHAPTKVGDGTKLQEGDPVYMAPELLQWDGGFGKPADIFSLGITILGIGSEYELPSRGPSWLELRVRPPRGQEADGVVSLSRTVTCSSTGPPCAPAACLLHHVRSRARHCGPGTLAARRKGSCRRC